MARIPFDNPNIDRIIDSSYEAYTDRLLDEAYGDHGERCKNCEYFVPAYGDDPAYCNKYEPDEIEDNDEWKQWMEDNVTDPEDSCEDWEWNISLDKPEEDDW